MTGFEKTAFHFHCHRTPGDADTLRDRRGTQLCPQLPDLRRVDLMGRPLYFPAADAARCPTSVST